MYTHITTELPKVLEDANIPIDWKRKSIFGHSMGGHGALTIYFQALQSPTPFKSASAFAPIANPILAPWGKKAFDGYLRGGVEEARKRYDATELVSKAQGPLKVLIHSVSRKGDSVVTKLQLISLTGHFRPIL
jgi:S-formylglutathione hydrolase